MQETTLELHEAIEALARLNAAPHLGGITREVYTPLYELAIELVAAQMSARGLATRIDSVGNLIGSLAGTAPGLPRVLTGSHIDTTLNAGAYDGVVGVLGGIEALGRIAAGPPPRRTLEVVAFAGEEPRFGMGCIGSRLMAGRLERGSLETLHDRDGVTLAEALRATGRDPDLFGEARVELSGLHAVVELHIEQGGTLENEGIPVGVVTRIAAAHDLRIEITGRAVHSGATPMHLRHDALAGAAEVTLSLERIARTSTTGTTVGTVGLLAAQPGAINVVPGSTTMLVDIRDSDVVARDSVVADFLRELHDICARRGLEVGVDVLQDNQPSACAPLVIDAVREGCRATGETYLEMHSGAYHDCMSFAPEVPIGMIFVPSAGGVSHSPDEFTEAAEIDRGVSVLTATLRRLAE
jgi:hydantoinase/carbamoylase family amidase